MKGLLIGIIVLAVVVGGFLVLSKDKTAPVSSPAGSIPTQSSPTSSESAPTREIMVSGDEYNFLPASLDIKQGETVKLTFKNVGKLPHNLVITELGVTSKTIAAGKEDSVTFTADKSGTFTTFCSVGNHRQLGMEGTLMVK